jgi:hypothetical protein
VLAAGALLGAAMMALACGGGGDVDAGPTTTAAPRATTTAPPPSTTASTTTLPPTTAPPAVVAPLTGLPFTGDPAVLARPALVVKIDNAEPRARPQQGINEADVVYEEMVEGSVTRFAAVFHSTDAAGRVIPVRSARTTDIALFSPLNRPLFAWSGANRDFTGLIKASPIVDVGHDALGGEYGRDPNRSATHDLYITTQQLWSHTPAGSVPPPPLFSYRPFNAPAPATARSVNHVTIVFGGGAGSAPVDWWWDRPSGGWYRAQRGIADVDEHGVQVAPANVVIQFVTYHDTGYVDTSGATVYEADLVGEGTAWVLTGGRLLEGRWRKADAMSVTQLIDAAGQPLLLAPGRTWVELPWEGRAAVTTG